MRFLFLILIFSGCGFLDDNLFLDDETYSKNELYLEMGKICCGPHSIKRPEVGSGGYGSVSGGSYYSGFGHSPGLGVRSVTKGSRKKSPQNDNEENPDEEKNAIDPKSTFIGVVNNYGAKAHDLAEKL